MTNLLSLSSLAALASGGKQSIHVIKSECKYYHYLCDGCDDKVNLSEC